MVVVKKGRQSKKKGGKNQSKEVLMNGIITTLEVLL